MDFFEDKDIHLKLDTCMLQQLAIDDKIFAML